jgi:hypothetical protein
VFGEETKNRVKISLEVIKRLASDIMKMDDIDRISVVAGIILVHESILDQPENE